MTHGALVQVLVLVLWECPGDPGYQCYCHFDHLYEVVEQCHDVDECLRTVGLCGLNAVCSNTDGSYRCDCHLGFINNKTETSALCVDVNECEENEDVCGPNAECFNTEGSFYCQCSAGFINVRGMVDFTFDGRCEVMFWMCQGPPPWVWCEVSEVQVFVSEGEWAARSGGGVFVLMGADFQVTCSVEFLLPGRTFQLNSPSLNLTLPAVNNSAHFRFTDAGPAHKGDYTCVYLLQVFNLNVTSSGSLHIRPGESDRELLLRALVHLVLMVLLFIPYVLYRRQVTRGRRSIRRAAAEPGTDAVSEMI